MKHKRFFMILFILMMMLPLSAAPVSVSRAEEIGTQHLAVQQETHPLHGFVITDTVPVVNDVNGKLLYHILNLSPQGFIVVGGETGRVAAYSYEENYPFSREHLLPELLKLDMETHLPSPGLLVTKAKPEQWPPLEHSHYNNGWLNKNASTTALTGILNYWKTHDGAADFQAGDSSASESVRYLKNDLKFTSARFNDLSDLAGFFKLIERDMRSGRPVQLELKNGLNIVLDGLRITSSGERFYHMAAPVNVWYSVTPYTGFINSAVTNINPGPDRQEPNNTRGDAYPILSDDFIQGRWHSLGGTNLKHNGDCDWYRFDAETGDNLWVRFHSADEAAVTLFKGDDAIETVFKEAGQKTVNLSHPVLESGTFFLAVSGKGLKGLSKDQTPDEGSRGYYNLEIGKDDARPRPPKELLSISISGPSSVDENSTATYTCRAYYDDDTSQDVTNYTNFSSSNIAVAFFEGHGLLFTENLSSNQSITITASYGGKTRTKGVTVINVVLTSLSVSGASSLYENTSTSYTATAHYSNGSTSSVTSSASWSNTSQYASMSGNTLNAGSVPSNQSDTVIATYTEGGVTKSGTKGVTIVNYKSLVSLSINVPFGINENSFAVGWAIAYFDDGSSQDVTNYASWWGSGQYYHVSGGGWIWTNSVPYDIYGNWVWASYTYNGVTRTASSTFWIYDRNY